MDCRSHLHVASSRQRDLCFTRSRMKPYMPRRHGVKWSNARERRELHVYICQPVAIVGDGPGGKAWRKVVSTELASLTKTVAASVPEVIPGVKKVIPADSSASGLWFPAPAAAEMVRQHLSEHPAIPAC